jgi:hypothetical protein
MDTKFFDVLQSGLPRKGISSDIVFCNVSAGEDLAEIAGRNLRFKGLDNFVSSFLSCDGVVATIILSDDYLCVTKVSLTPRR